MVEMEILKRGRRENNPRKGRESGYTCCTRIDVVAGGCEF